MLGPRLSPLALTIGLAAMGLAAPALQVPSAPALAQERSPAPPTPAASPAVPDKLRSFVPITENMLLKPRSENWITFRNGYRMWGYSPLSQIDAGNVGELRLVWSRAMQDGPQEVEPYVYDGVMFLANAEDVVQALDATSGDLLWEYRRKLPNDIRSTGTMFRFRNIALFDDKVYLASQDMYLVALEARTGRMLWETKRGDYKDKIAATAGPVIIKGKAITGTRCDPSSPLVGGCYITAHDVRHGEEAWRLHVAAKPGEPGGDTWGDLPLEERRSSSPWMSGSYDPELNLVFWGTGVAQNLRREQLKGAANKDLLYTNSTVAVNPDTGKMVWYYQHLPADFRDLDHAFERLIVETAVSPSADEVPWINPTIKPGERRKVLTGIPGKTGIVWTLDAKTGEFLWARPTTVQTVMASVDPRTGRPVLDESERPYSCPFLFGGKNQPSGAYSPDTNAMYMPLNNVCNAVPFWDQPGRGPTHVPGADPARSPVGRVEAISAATGKTLWKYEQRAPVYGSILATGGNLVFSGDVVRRFRAFHAASGKILWETILNGPVGSRPMTYSVRGRQYLAVGAGGVTQGSAYLALAPELSTTRGGGNTMFVFALPER